MKIKLIGRWVFITQLLLLIFSTHTFAQTCNTVFQHYYGGSGNDEGRAVIYTPDQRVVIAGKSSSGSAGGYDGLLMKLSNEGDVLWNHVIGGMGDDQLEGEPEKVEKGPVMLVR